MYEQFSNNAESIGAPYTGAGSGSVTISSQTVRASTMHLGRYLYATGIFLSEPIKIVNVMREVEAIIASPVIDPLDNTSYKYTELTLLGTSFPSEVPVEFADIINQESIVDFTPVVISAITMRPTNVGMSRSFKFAQGQYLTDYAVLFFGSGISFSGQATFGRFNYVHFMDY